MDLLFRGMRVWGCTRATPHSTPKILFGSPAGSVIT